MTFNPLEQRGIPLDRQLRSWRELNVQPIDPDRCDPYTRCRIITMNGIEVGGDPLQPPARPQHGRPGGQAAAGTDPLHRGAAAEGRELACCRASPRSWRRRSPTSRSPWTSRRGSRAWSRTPI
ncbi:hypothetical protein LT493_30290 [Streptomyces tricolor]|nr:hypothetical protein [Streptomyces tricolor]